jgi:hypothetical protein
MRKLSDWGGTIAAFIFVVVVNGMANAIPINGQTTGGISAKYPSLFTPAGFTFAIWGLIYLSLAAFVIYQALPAQRSRASLARISRWIQANFVANAAWIFAWHYDLLWLSLLLMLVILITLIAIYRILDVVNPARPAAQRWLVQFPIGLYTGWIAVATIANISAVQTGMGWDNLGTDAVTWTLIKLAIAGAIGATVVLRRLDVVFVLVVAWAAYGISVKQAAAPAVAGAATTLSILAVLLAAAQILKRLSNR